MTIAFSYVGTGKTCGNRRKRRRHDGAAISGGRVSGSSESRARAQSETSDECDRRRDDRRYGDLGPRRWYRAMRDIFEQLIAVCVFHRIIHGASASYSFAVTRSTAQRSRRSCPYRCSGDENRRRMKEYIGLRRHRPHGRGPRSDRRSARRRRAGTPDEVASP